MTPLLTRIQAVKVCQVKDGESVAILEIEESRQAGECAAPALSPSSQLTTLHRPSCSDVGQSTKPAELPISGLAGQIELKIESETHKYFTIQDKQLRLIRPLDRDATLSEVSGQPGSATSGCPRRLLRER